MHVYSFIKQVLSLALSWAWGNCKERNKIQK